MDESSSSLADLHKLCLDLYQNPFPRVANPPTCKRRASVALIIRIRPIYPDYSTESLSTKDIGPDTESRVKKFIYKARVRRGDT